MSVRRSDRRGEGGSAGRGQKKDGAIAQVEIELQAWCYLRLI